MSLPIDAKLPLQDDYESRSALARLTLDFILELSLGNANQLVLFFLLKLLDFVVYYETVSKTVGATTVLYLTISFWQLSIPAEIGSTSCSQLWHAGFALALSVSLFSFKLHMQSN